MSRLFTAVEVPYSVARMLERLRGGVPGVRWIDSENYHITLNFIGDVEGRMAREVGASLADVAGPSFELRLADVGCFGRAKPHSLWAGVEPSPLIRDLQADIARAVSRLGIALESRKFQPHVTVGRIRHADDSALAGWLSRHSGFRSDWFTVDRFVLMSSRPSRGGGPYAVEHAYPLEAWPADEWIKEA
jgi:RNA 2',3'-cyclic 3'-phosphodiesterase